MTEIVVDRQAERVEIPLDYLLVQIGAEPQTGWLEDILVLDEKGYIVADRDIPKDVWPEGEGREPFNYETSMAGIFTGGDVHSGSPKRMSCAIGEGHMLAVNVHRYLTLKTSG
jgi:thioredoxin reductase (NADPH)